MQEQQTYLDALSDLVGEFQVGDSPIMMGEENPQIGATSPVPQDGSVFTLS